MLFRSLIQQAVTAAATTTINVYMAYTSAAAAASSNIASEVALAVAGANGQNLRTPDPRPLNRIGGGDLPTIAVDPKNPNVVYSASTVMWRTEDAGMNWSAVRGAPGGDDYQRYWINPNNPRHLMIGNDGGLNISWDQGFTWDYVNTMAAAYTYWVTADMRRPYRVYTGLQDNGSWGGMSTTRGSATPRVCPSQPGHSERPGGSP